jgi:hypothetical protein
MFGGRRRNVLVARETSSCAAGRAARRSIAHELDLAEAAATLGADA